MLFNKSVFTTLASALLSAAVVKSDALPAIEVVGNHFFFTNNGSEFYIRGIAYQADTANVTGGATINDPLADYETCSRDIPYLQQLATNVIRVYALNTSLDHSRCMQALNDAGIYVIADLGAPDTSIDRSDPEWTVALYDRYKDVVDILANYTNVLGFFAGNEVTNSRNNTDASPFVKAAIRDVKTYINEMNYRKIPVGYSSNDDSYIRKDLAEYFACGDESVKADFFGINMYEWCGNSTFQKSGYAARTREFSNLSIPIFFSEYGCNAVQPRRFTEVQALFSDEMTGVWSGGIVYMYFEEVNNYGLVTIEPDGQVATLADFNYYSEEIHSIHPTSQNTRSFTPSVTSNSCPTADAYWNAATKLPPTPDENLCACMDEANTCVVSDDVDEDDYAELFSYVCSQISCAGVTANGTTGVYGAYSFCSPRQKLNFVLNMYYESNGENADACNFSGSASIQKPSTASACSAALSSVGSQGTNVMSGTITASAASSSTSTTQTSSTTSSRHKKNTGSVVRASFNQALVSSIATLVALAGLGFAMI